MRGKYYEDKGKVDDIICYIKKEKDGFWSTN